MRTVPSGRGTGWSSASIPAPISTRPGTGSAARTIRTGRPTRSRVKNFVAPVNVIDRSKEAAANPDYLLTPESIKAWEKEHGDDRSRNMGAAAHRLVQAQRQRRRPSSTPTTNGPHSPGPTAEAISYLISKGVDRLGPGDGRHRRRFRWRHEPALPGAYAHAQGQSLWPREPLPARPASAQGRRADRRAAEVRGRAPDRRCARWRWFAGLSVAYGETPTIVIVGGGINGLVAAAMLGKKGRKVLLLERSDRVGGCLRTEEITAPGFIHDVMATTLVLFLTSPAYGAIGKDLEARGFAVAHSDLPTGVIRPDGSHLLFSRDRARNVATFEACAEGDGEAFAREMDRMGADAPFLFALLGGTLWSRQTAMLSGARGLEAGPAGARRLVRRGAAPGARLSRSDLRLGRRPCALGAVGPALRPQSGERLFRADGQGHRLRDRNGGLSDRGRRGAEPAGRAFERLIADTGRPHPVRRGRRPGRDAAGRPRARRRARIRRDGSRPRRASSAR